MPRQSIPPAIRCDGRHHMGGLLLEGYTIPGQNLDYCAWCREALPKDVQDKCVPFKNEPLELDSRDIADVMAAGMCLQSNPCQHTGVIELKGEEEEEPGPKEWNNIRGLVQITASMSGLAICRFALIAEQPVDQIDSHVTRYLDRVGPITPGEVYTIRTGITVRVHDGFVDPRTLVKKPTLMEQLYKRWRKSFPQDFETFMRELKQELEEEK